MKSLWQPRVWPFAFYIAVMMLSGYLEATGMDVRWLYAVRAGGTALLLGWWWRGYAELAGTHFLSVRAAMLSVFAGLFVFVAWINLDAGWMVLGQGAGYVPTLENGALDWPMVAMRWAGAALVVPVMEELFWRSFLMRWIDRHDFLAMAPATVTLRALLISSLLFASEHSLWLAGFVAGLVYGLLYTRTRNLWAPVLAHAVTNGVLGAWVIYTGHWSFW